MREQGASPPEASEAVEAVEAVAEARPLDREAEALLEYAHSTLVSSVPISRDFCKFMIGLSVGAVPAFLGLYELVLGEEMTLQASRLLLPLLLFVVAAGVYCWGFMPTSAQVRFHVLSDVRVMRERALRKGRIAMRLGTFLFAAGLVLAAVFLLFPG